MCASLFPHQLYIYCTNTSTVTGMHTNYFVIPVPISLSFVCLCFSLLSLELGRCSSDLFSVQQTTYRIGNHVYYWVWLRPDRLMWRKQHQQLTVHLTGIILIPSWCCRCTTVLYTSTVAPPLSARDYLYTVCYTVSKASCGAGCRREFQSNSCPKKYSLKVFLANSSWRAQPTSSATVEQFHALAIDSEGILQVSVWIVESLLRYCTYQVRINNATV